MNLYASQTEKAEDFIIALIKLKEHLHCIQIETQPNCTDAWL